MKKAVMALLISSIALLGCNENEETTIDSSKQYDLRVTVTGLTDEGGNLYIGVRNKSQAVVAEQVLPASEELSILLEQIPAGEYDIFTFQDIDRNNELAMAGMMPKEPLGYSGNKVLTGPPQFSSTSFKLTQDSEQAVMLFDYR